ncbi:RluA family pseudouridine synthase [Ligilactobacillus salivarius]|uniref:RluA family pseudouridine synthase n=1 Tax=Ligilactobacillus salivarius TaxID=1624 RepID=UPI00263AF482|nr:RluA family pseudouridine synthase [Ligilactobacillus salivarius]MDN4847631.1 RluA family pseudouridine synthase [Ligilactobacillus salivarius]
MSKYKFERTVNAEFGGISLRALLSEKWLLPRKFIHFLRIRENVKINDNYYPMNTIVQGNQKIELIFEGDEFRTATSNYIVDKGRKIPIIFENEDLLVVNKPQGIKSHPNQPYETGTLMNYIAGYLDVKDEHPYMVHRLDMLTSGAMIVAKNPVVVPILTRLISMHTIKRDYLAVTEGIFDQKEGVIDLPIGKDENDKRKRKVDGIGALPARTHYQVIKEFGNNSVVYLRLETGRTHQLRVHLSAMGHPIVGDVLYNHVSEEKHMMLHGYKQKLTLPFSMRELEIKADIPKYFTNYEEKVKESKN